MTPAAKQALYREVLVREFIREFRFLADVAAGRADAKGDFTDKLLAVIQFGGLGALDQVPLPGFNLVTGALEVAIDWANAARKEGKSEYIGEQQWEIDEVQLRILLETVALEASRRYEFILAQLSPNPVEGVIPFALAGVERMLEYVARNGLPLTAEHLLMGLIKGHSGAYVSGFQNTRLQLDKTTTVLDKNPKTTYTAEGMYGRPAFLNTALTSPAYFSLIDKKQAVNQIDLAQTTTTSSPPSNPPPLSLTARLTQAVQKASTHITHKKEAWYHYGYTKVKKGTTDPKYGYVSVPQTVIDHFRYVSQPASDQSPALKALLSQYSPQWAVITQRHVVDYLAARAQTPDLTCLQWLSQQANRPIALAFFQAEADPDYDWTALTLAGADFSGCVLLGVTLAGSLAKSRWVGSVLTGANLTGVTTAHEANFSGARVEKANAHGANLAGAVFTQADFSAADVSQADLRQCQLTGAVWVQADLNGTQFDDPKQLHEEQTRQATALVNQQTALNRLSERLEGQEQKLQDLLCRLEAARISPKTEEEHSQTTAALQTALQQLAQERQAREAFARYCEGEVQQLRRHIQQVGHQASAQQDQLTAVEAQLTALQAQQASLPKLLSEVMALSEQGLQHSQQLKEVNTHLQTLQQQMAKNRQAYQTAVDSINIHLTTLQHDVAALHGIVKGHTEKLRRHSEALRDQALKQQALEAQQNALLAQLNQKGLGAKLSTEELTHVTQFQQQRLRAFYQRKEHTEIKLIGDDSGQALTLDTLFVNLVIVKEDEQRQREEDSLKTNEKPGKAEAKDNVADEKRLGLLRTYEDIHRAKVPIALTQLFQARPSEKAPTIPTKAPQKLLLLGRAGIGKSTLCKYLAYQWMQGQLLTEFAWVFHLELKRIAFDADFAALKTLPELLQAYYWPQLEVYQVKQVWEHLERQGQKVLWLLDGYDEVAHLQKPLIEKGLLQQPYYLLTSRPYAAQPQRRQVDEVLENIGLTPDNVQVYIDKYFQGRYAQPEKGVALNAWLAQQSSVAALCAIPIYVELLCSVWLTDQASLQREGHLSTIDLYNQLSHKLMRRLVQKLQPDPTERLPEDIVIDEQPAVLFAKAFLGRLAFEGLKGGRLLIEGTTFQASFEALKEEILQLPEALPPTQTQLVLSPRLTPERYRPLRQALQATIEQTLQAQTDPTHKRLDLLTQLLAAGFLKNVGTATTLMKDSYYFIHLSFQEYFAALYLAYHLEAEAAFIAAHKYDPAWQLAWTMVAGLLKDDALRLNRFFDLLLAKPRDLYGLYEATLLAQCLEACEISTQLKAETREALLSHLQKWIDASLQQQETAVLDALMKLPQISQILGLEKRIVAYVCLHDISQENREFGYTILGSDSGLSQESIQALLVGSVDENEHIRRTALSALGQLPNPSLEIIQSLQAGTQDEKEYVRQAALAGLGKLPNPSLEIIQVLLTGAQDKAWSVRKEARDALGNLSNPVLETIQALLVGARDANENVRQAALHALGQLSDPDEEVIQVLLLGAQNKDNNVREAALLGLGKLPHPSSEVIQALLWSVKDKDWSVRKAAWDVLGQLSDPNNEVIQALLVGAQDKDNNVREAALRGLKKLSSSGEVIQALLESTRNVNRNIREAALRALGQLSDPSDKIIQALLASIQDEDSHVREVALLGLGKLPHPSSEVIQALLWSVKDKDWSVCKAAWDMLGQLPNPSSEVIQVLLEGAQDKKAYVREAALPGLGNLPNPSADIIEVLLSGAEDKECDVRTAALLGLGKLSNPSADIIKVMLSGAEDKECDVRTAALLGLGKFPNPSSEIIELLLAGAYDGFIDVREAALFGLGKLPNPNFDIISALLNLTAYDEVSYIRDVAYDALKQLANNPSVEVIQALLEGAQNEDSYVRSLAISTLCNPFNSLSSEAIQALLVGTQDKKAYVRQAALLGLGYHLKPDKIIIQALLAGAEDKKKDVRHAALSGLRHSLHPGLPIEFAMALVRALHDSNDMNELIPLPHLIHAYPNWMLHQSQARLALQYQLKQVGTALIKLDDKHYQCVINKQVFTVACANPNQLKKDLAQIRWVPMVLKPKTAFAFFSHSPNRQSERRVTEKRQHFTM